MEILERQFYWLVKKNQRLESGIFCNVTKTSEILSFQKSLGGQPCEYVLKGQNVVMVYYGGHCCVEGGCKAGSGVL